MWINEHQTAPQTEETPAEYGGGIWVCDKCQSPDLDESDGLCFECKDKPRAYQHQLLSEIGIEAFVDILDDALLAAKRGDQDSIDGLAGLKALFDTVMEQDIYHASCKTKMGQFAACGEYLRNSVKSIMAGYQE